MPSNQPGIQVAVDPDGAFVVARLPANSAGAIRRLAADDVRGCRLVAQDEITLQKRALTSTSRLRMGQATGMTIFEYARPLAWGELDLPLLGITRDCSGDALDPPAGFSLAVDGRYLWFAAHHRDAADVHPEAMPGRFLAGLWQHDCAELFIADPRSGRYFEFNLAPNGAWWCCEFTAPRVRAEEVDIEMPGVATFADLAADGAWLTAMAIPLDLLRARLDFGTRSRANVTFMLGGHKRRQVSAADLGGSAPDYHSPERFPEVKFTTPPPRSTNA